MSRSEHFNTGGNDDARKFAEIAARNPDLASATAPQSDIQIPAWGPPVPPNTDHPEFDKHHANLHAMDRAAAKAHKSKDMLEYHTTRSSFAASNDALGGGMIKFNGRNMVCAHCNKKLDHISKPSRTLRSHLRRWKP